uniref:Uncharacterized protein n=1 Tax=Timema tahoe TaxID=61484 RepID=A0A7R9FKB6_9NEOP|nr:unnamed protein product [Timema tahoe]
MHVICVRSRHDHGTGLVQWGAHRVLLAVWAVRFAFLALFAIFAIAFAQESAPKESLKGSEAVYLASPYGYAGYAGYGAYPYAGYGVGYNAYSGLYYR